MLTIQLNIKKNSKIFDLRKEFNSIYHNLALHIIKKPAIAPETELVYGVYRTVGECCKKAKDGIVDISPNRKIRQVIKDFEKLGIDIVVCQPVFNYDYSPNGKILHLYPAIDMVNPTLEELNKPKKGKEDYYHWL